MPPVASQLADALGDGWARSVSELEAMTGVRAATIRQTLNRHPEHFIVHREGYRARWTLREGAVVRARVRRGILDPGDDRHGTDRGYHAHRWAGDDPCAPCRSGHAQAAARREGRVRIPLDAEGECPICRKRRSRPCRSCVLAAGYLGYDPARAGRLRDWLTTLE